MAFLRLKRLWDEGIMSATRPELHGFDFTRPEVGEGTYAARTSTDALIDVSCIKVLPAPGNG